jgi:indole-3-glycerol phosphate synthase
MVKDLAGVAGSVGVEVVMEVHNEKDLMENLHPEIDVIGVNNRDLKTFSVSIENSIRLGEKIPGSFMKISESGINHPGSIVELRKHGYQGFLIGEYFMQYSRPEKRCAAFIQKIKELEKENLTEKE